MFTKEWETRNLLKVGDQIDCLDEYIDWYTSEIVDIRTTKEKDCCGTGLREYLVAFRYPDEKYGQTKHSANKIVGWSPKFDKWICATSPKIVLHGTIAHRYV